MLPASLFMSMAECLWDSEKEYMATSGALAGTWQVYQEKEGENHV